MKTVKFKSIIITLAILFLIAAYAIWETNRPGLFGGSKEVHVVEEIEIPPNDWQVHKQIDASDTSTVIKAVWDQKYGVTKTEYCIVVFSNDKENQYKLVAPWFSDVIIERANANNIKFEKISKEKMGK